ncbi:MAG TPA: DNA glycosylase [Candidatus Aquilonibacter sp.]|nr:DNA glycosylase [Candidatus Aquilonibacter sp.]
MSLSVSSSSSKTKTVFHVHDYDLSATLDSGQVFRWRQGGNSWTSVIGKNFVRLTQVENEICAETARPQNNWDWLCKFLQTEIELETILKTFPGDPPMREAVAAWRGLRVLRQEPWECLASFILSSTKQIVQIQQIIALLCERFGDEIAVPQNETSAFSFPSPEKIANATETELRNCKMGFRAPHLLAAARQIAGGLFDLEKIRTLDHPGARAELMKLTGVGAKIADCVLLFAYGFDSAFPVDVWVERALRELYFPRRHVGEKKLLHFAATHFGPHAGYAQQYLFHFMRTKTDQPPRGQRSLVFISQKRKIHGLRKIPSTTEATTSEK